MKVGFIVDTTAYFPREYTDKHNIGVVHMKYSLDGVEYVEGRPGEPEFEGFFELYSQAKDTIKTACPSVQDYEDAYNKALEQHDCVICITLASVLSATNSMAQNAAEAFEGKVHVIDGKNGAGPTIQFLIELGIDLASKGVDAEEIVARIKERSDSSVATFSLNDLTYVVRGGRLSPSKAFMANMLGVKPLLIMNEEGLKPVSKIRGTAKIIQALLDGTPEDAVRISIPHINMADEAAKILEAVKQKCPNAIITIDTFGPIIGGHTGPKLIATLACTK